MGDVPRDANQGTLLEGDSFSLCFIGNASSLLMATLNLIGLVMGVLVWIFYYECIELS